jgi:hypothetical protein
MRAAAATILTVIPVAAVNPQPATAAGQCSLVVPARVAVTAPYRGVPVSLGADCAAANVVYANWSGYHPTRGISDIVIFDETTTGVWDLYDNQPLWRRDWRGFASDAEWNTVAANSPATDIRVGSWAGIGATRVGGRVTVRIRSVRYAYTLDRYIGWAGSRGTVQWRQSAAKPWTNLKWVYPGRSGDASFSYNAPVREYRVVFPNLASIWGATSGFVRR